MKLAELAAHAGIPLAIGGESAVSGFAIDSRKVAPGNVFGAFEGLSVNGEDFIPAAIAAGAVAVVARPHEKWGETPCAYVAVKPGTTITEAEVIAFCRANMANFKAPKTVIFGELPKTSTGKIQKFILREQARRLELQS